ncbi:LysR family transcriptional regulator [Teichococcus cervicalis]|uniref:Transcriptional regulator, LysR family n=1 Tax=Pseudoroseomonas cervicalis ATCC 49957 TaxID=525371 RepID=D5RN88_9PROT|nr:LysR substrate-binding domain-containing protein [Pseudoroseomonas cervicalis]EFH11231.1 transcriptional regulator, LysR family [Pseudoroseomonas cervicalis ATCC 49957]
MLTLRQIEVFRAVLQAGSMMGAARRLGIAQPTVTRVIRRMEDVIGVPLFDRAAGRLTPTAEARRVLEEVDRAFEGLSAALQRASRAARPEEGHLQLGVSPSLGRVLVPRALAGLVAAHPGLSLRLDVLSVSQVVAYLRDGPGEAAVTLYPLLEAGIHSQHVGQGAMVALVPRGWDLASRPALRPRDLEGRALAMFEGYSVHGQALSAWLALDGASPGRRHQVRFAESAAALAEAGLAIALVDAFSAMAVDERRVAILPALGAGRFNVYLHRVLDRVQGRFLPPFATLLSQAIAERSAGLPMP